MDKFPYILVPNSIKQFLDKIQSTGIPNKVTYDYLGTIGFKSSNHRSLIQIMKSGPSGYIVGKNERFLVP